MKEVIRRVSPSKIKAVKAQMHQAAGVYAGYVVKFGTSSGNAHGLPAIIILRIGPDGEKADRAKVH